MSVDATDAMTQEEFEDKILPLLMTIEKWKLPSALHKIATAINGLLNSVPGARTSRKRRDRQKRKVDDLCQCRPCPESVARWKKIRSDRFEAKTRTISKPKQVYSEYLKSAEWMALRQRILNRDRHQCRLCGNKAYQVHHRSYDKDTMAGKRLKQLVSLCGECHRDIHFIDDDKLSVADTDVRFMERLKEVIVNDNGTDKR